MNLQMVSMKCMTSGKIKFMSHCHLFTFRAHINGLIGDDILTMHIFKNTFEKFQTTILKLERKNNLAFHVVG